MPPLSLNEIRRKAIQFSNEWKDETNERAESQTFWNEFFDIFGIKRRRVASFEEIVKYEEGYGFIDLLWKGKLLVEHKSKGKSLDTAYGEAKDYLQGIDEKDFPKFILVSDFERFRLIDLDNNAEEYEFELKNLVDNIDLFNFISGYKKRIYKDEDPVNIEAASHMGKLHEKLKENGYEGHPLELYITRLLFCMFADDTRIFEKDLFLDYIKNRTSEDGSDLAGRLAQLFDVLNTPENQRQKTLDEFLALFPYINGKLFEEVLMTASFDSEMREILLDCCFLNWSKVSPAIFGSLFQAVMDDEEQRDLGGHYTSEKNILKVINSLFLEDLWVEFEKIKTNRNKLKSFHEKISKLKFLDPACGCGNFLIIAYRELRLIEIEVLKVLSNIDGYRQQVIDITKASKIDVDKFYGIEIKEFPVRISEVSMWMMDHLMNMKLSDELGEYYTRLPLKNAANIINENALQVEWKDIVKINELSYILGNPPFSGKQYRNPIQNEDMKHVFEGVKNYLKLDYVAAWYIKAAQYIKDTDIKVGFVSTNSISQGEQVGILWDELFNKYGIKIHYAHRTFKWSNESGSRAAVYVVIIGFANYDNNNKILYEYEKPTSEAHEKKVKNINPYLVEGDDLVIKSRRKTVCRDALPISFGSMPNDAGNLLLNDEERDKLLRVEPYAEKFIKPLISGREFLNGGNKWCLWLKDAQPKDLLKMPEVMKRVEKVKEHRLESKRDATQKLAATPYLFGEDRHPDSDYLLIPLTSSMNRKYIPMAFVDKNTIANNTCAVIRNCQLYEFGLLTSLMHMTWVNYVCGRLKGDYRYSNEIVYNNFPWPENPSNKNIRKVEKSARKVLKLREKFSDNTLAELYDPRVMPLELVNAHKELDRAVDLCYRPQIFPDEIKRIEFLFDLYEKYDVMQLE